MSVVDDLIYPRHTLGNVHARYTSEMESFKGHLGGRLTDTLSCQSSYRLSRLNYTLVYLLYVYLEKQLQLEISYTIESVL